MVRFHPPAPRSFPSPTTTPTPFDPIDLVLGRVLAREAPEQGERWLVAFSGGPDSTALAAALAPLAAARGLDIELAHVDHLLDPGSTDRAAHARTLAERIGLVFHLLTVDAVGQRRRRESPEAAARRLRYAALEALQRDLGATRILTAHQRDDQIETVLLKLLRDAPLERLGGIAERRGVLVRPLLAVRRAEVEARLAHEGLTAIHDPTNDDLTLPRNRARQLLLPRLRTAEPALDAALLALAARADALRAALDRRFSLHFQADEKTNTSASIEGKNNDDSSAAPEPSGATPPRELPLPWKPVSGPGEAAASSTGDGVGSLSVSVARFRSLPEPLQLPALRWFLTERLGVGHLPSLLSLEEFLSLSRRGKDARLRLPGATSELVARGGRLVLAGPEPPAAPFAYTFCIPGEVELPELGLRLRIRRSPVEPWMLRGERTRTGLRADAAEATVRTRRSGDRLRPLGSPGSRKLKAVLVDRGVPAAARDRLPLLEIAGELAWIPGVTIGERFALRGEAECWLAELEPLAGDGPAGEDGGERKTTT